MLLRIAQQAWDVWALILEFVGDDEFKCWIYGVIERTPEHDKRIYMEKSTVMLNAAIALRFYTWHVISISYTKWEKLYYKLERYESYTRRWLEDVYEACLAHVYRMTTDLIHLERHLLHFDLLPYHSSTLAEKRRHDRFRRAKAFVGSDTSTCCSCCYASHLHYKERYNHYYARLGKSGKAHMRLSRFCPWTMIHQIIVEVIGQKLFVRARERQGSVPLRGVETYRVKFAGHYVTGFGCRQQYRAHSANY